MVRIQACALSVSCTAPLHPHVQEPEGQMRTRTHICVVESKLMFSGPFSGLAPICQACSLIEQDRRGTCQRIGTSWGVTQSNRVQYLTCLRMRHPTLMPWLQESLAGHVLEKPMRGFALVAAYYGAAVVGTSSGESAHTQVACQNILLARGPPPRSRAGGLY